MTTDADKPQQPDPTLLAAMHRTARRMLASLAEPVAEPTDDREINRFEKDYLDSERIPPSYRDFLVLQDGWERCWRGFSFGGTQTLSGTKLREEIDRIIDAYALGLGFDVDDEDARRKHHEGDEFSPFGQFIFGCNYEGDLLIFDRKRVTAEGEMPVVMWNPEDGVIEEWESFESLMQAAMMDTLDRMRT